MCNLCELPFRLFKKQNVHIFNVAFFKWNSSCLTDQMNVCWHRPSQKSSAFMYITFRMSSNGTRRVCHLSASPRRWSHHTSKHQRCNTWSVPSSHISTSRRICRQIQCPAKTRGYLGAGVSVSLPLWGTFTLHLCVWLNHSTQFVLIIIITARTEGQERGCKKATSSAGTLVDQDLSFLFFLFVLLYYYFLIDSHIS